MSLSLEGKKWGNLAYPDEFLWSSLQTAAQVILLLEVSLQQHSFGKFGLRTKLLDQVVIYSSLNYFLLILYQKGNLALMNYT